MKQPSLPLGITIGSNKMITLYGIKNCDTVKKAQHWLDEQGVDYNFHDLRNDGINEATIRGWCEQLGWDKVLNKRSTTYRQLSETDKAGLDANTAPALMAAQPTLIKRPVFVRAGTVHVGFSETAYRELTA